MGSLVVGVLIYYLGVKWYPVEGSWSLIGLQKIFDNDLSMQAQIHIFLAIHIILDLAQMAMSALTVRIAEHFSRSTSRKKLSAEEYYMMNSEFWKTTEQSGIAFQSAAFLTLGVDALAVNSIFTGRDNHFYLTMKFHEAIREAIRAFRASSLGVHEQAFTQEQTQYQTEYDQWAPQTNCPPKIFQKVNKIYALTEHGHCYTDSELRYQQPSGLVPKTDCPTIFKLWEPIYEKKEYRDELVNLAWYR